MLSVNDTLSLWLEYEATQLENQSFNSILSVGNRVFCQTHFLPLLKLQGYVEELYFSLRTKQGEAVPMMVNSQRVNREERVVYDCIFMRMSRRDEYENRILLAKQLAEASDQAKAEILKTMSHEFRTPLNAIVGFTEILSIEMRDVLSEEQKEYLRAINTGSEEILHLTSDILRFAQIELGQIKTTLQPVMVDQIFASAESIMAPHFSKAGINYCREKSDSGAKVLCDSNYLENIIVNILENAVKFTQAEGSVSVSCSETENRLLLHIRDTGCGIAEAQHERIFEPFIQINRAEIKSNQKGAGLGLAISRRLAQAMNTEISVRSTLGEGSVFTISLPKATV